MVSYLLATLLLSDTIMLMLYDACLLRYLQNFHFTANHVFDLIR